MNDHVIPHNRRPIVIADSQLTTGQTSTSIRSDDAEALLRDYLRLIRKVRNQQRARNIALRRVDIETLARHLDLTDDQVLARLADLMGATRRQRATMLAVLSTGAALITVASPMSAAASTTDQATLDQTEPPVVVDADEITHVHVGVGRPLGFPSPDEATVPRRAPVLELQADLASGQHATAAHDFARPPAPTSVADTDSGDPATPRSESSEPAIGPDGAVVAVGRAPVPPPAVETGTDADGNTVAVGQPPVPPAPAPEPTERVDVTEAASPATLIAPETGVPSGTDADGNTVAVGQPPVPPTSDV